MLASEKVLFKGQATIEVLPGGELVISFGLEDRSDPQYANYQEVRKAIGFGSSGKNGKAEMHNFDGTDGSVVYISNS